MTKKTVFVLLAAVLGSAACGGAKVKAGSKLSSANSGDTLGRIDQNPRCELDGGREVLLDLNQDGKPDVRKIYVSGPQGDMLSCREADLNFDGNRDFFVFFDSTTGQKKRDEVDLDHDGMVDIVTTYIGGNPIKQELDTNSDGLIDRVRFLDGDVPQRVEGDTDGDGRIDYWEYYDGGKLLRIGMDTDGDGKAETWSRDEESENAAAEADDEEEKAPEKEPEKEPKKEPEKEPEKAAGGGGGLDENPFGP